MTPTPADIVARLRWMAGPHKPNALDDAADCIERLVQEMERRENCKEDAAAA